MPAVSTAPVADRREDGPGHRGTHEEQEQRTDSPNHRKHQTSLLNEATFWVESVTRTAADTCVSPDRHRCTYSRVIRRCRGRWASEPDHRNR